MFDKLKLTEKRYDEVSEKLTDPDVINDNNLYRDLMKEFKTLDPIIQKYREYLAAKKNFDESKELLDAGGLDRDFKEMAQAEYEENGCYYYLFKGESVSQMHQLVNSLKENDAALFCAGYEE